MKKLFFFIALGSIMACDNEADNNNNNQMGAIGPGPSSADSVKTDSVNYPYTASYANQFSVGNSQHAQTVLNVWKSWDSGNMSQSKDAFADSVTMVFADGSTLKGNRDSIINASQQYRDNYDTISSNLEAVVPLSVDEKNETWVSVWGTETTTKNGKKDSMKLHETWRLNNAGKIYHVQQYSAKPPVADKLKK